MVRHFKLPDGSFSPIDFRRLKTRFPYIMLVPQTKFLEFLAQEGKKYPNFRLRMVANVAELIEEHGQVCGVRYQSTDGWHTVRALLTVGADGRFSKVRQLAGFEPIKTSPPMDILWFELPHLPGDEHSDRVMGGFGKGRLLAVFDRGDHWQIGYVFPKGRYQQLRAEGIDAFRKSIAEVEPRFTKHVESLREWNQCSLLSVEANRCPIWYKPGLLLIGDAAHVMSPVGGVGINYAVQDAVVATNVLTRPLHQGKVRAEDLHEVQRQREFPIRVVQAMQSAMQTRMIAGAPQSPGSFKVPWQMRVFLQDTAAARHSSSPDGFRCKESSPAAGGVMSAAFFARDEFETVVLQYTLDLVSSMNSPRARGVEFDVSSPMPQRLARLLQLFIGKREIVVSVRIGGRQL